MFLAPLAAPAAAAGQGWRQPGDTITDADLMTAYKFLYGDKGMKLYDAYIAAGGTVNLAHMWSKTLKLNRWPNLKIWIENRDKALGDAPYHPGVAAQLLWSGLCQMLAEALVRNQLDVDDPDTLEFLEKGWAAVGPAACDVGIAAANLYLSGIAIVNEGANIAISLNEVSEGNYLAIAGVIPFIPATIFSKGGKLLLKKSSGQVLETIHSAEALAALKQVYREKDLRVMGNILDQEQFREAIRKVVSGANGAIKAPVNRNGLRDRMLQLRSKPFPTAQAHHDFVWAEREWFAGHGIDVNDPAFGRWVSEADHKLWHERMSPKFNEFWDEFIKREKAITAGGGLPFSVQEVLDKLAEARSRYTVNNGN